MFQSKIYAVDIFMPSLDSKYYLYNNNVNFSYSSIKDIIINCNDEKIGRVLVYKKGRKFKEIITGIEIPYILIEKNKYLDYKFYLSQEEPIYFRICKKFKHLTVRYSAYYELGKFLVTPDELEEYIENIKDMKNYDDLDLNYANYVDAYKQKLDGLFEKANESYKEFIKKYNISCERAPKRETLKMKELRKIYKV